MAFVSKQYQEDVAMSESEQNDSCNDVFTLTTGAADPRPDSSTQFTPSTPAGQALAPPQVSEAERDRNNN